jgi:hypothetical protein
MEILFQSILFLQYRARLLRGWPGTRPLAYARGTVPESQSEHGRLFQQPALGESFESEWGGIDEALSSQD